MEDLALGITLHLLDSVHWKKDPKAEQYSKRRELDSTFYKRIIQKFGRAC